MPSKGSLGKVLAFSLCAVSVLGLLTLLVACNMSVKDKKGEEKVDINTPLGGLHVHTDVDPSQTGLSVYPGAKPKIEDDGKDKNRANVDISTSVFGVKVVAIEYESDDPPDKITAYYNKELRKYGKVLQCPGGGGAGAVKTDHDSKSSSRSKELTCDKSDGGHNIELKVGTDDNQHLVAIEPQGKGTKFALVYVQTRGERQPI
jgi:hypothetical protein